MVKEHLHFFRSTVSASFCFCFSTAWNKTSETIGAALFEVSDFDETAFLDEDDLRGQVALSLGATTSFIMF